MVVTEADITDLNEGDREAVALAGFAAWQSSGAFRDTHLDPAVIERVRKAFESFAHEASGDVAVVKLDGVVVGWGAREGAPDYISDIWVHPQWQGRGVGRRLVEPFVDRMRGADIPIAKIATHARNENAIKLYERCGFEIVWSGTSWSEHMQIELPKVRLEKVL